MPETDLNSKLADLIIAPSPAAFRLAFVAMFQATYELTATTLHQNTPAGDALQYAHDIRAAIPLATCAKLRTLIQDEPLTQTRGIGAVSLRILDLFVRRAIDDSYAAAPMEPHEAHWTILLCELEDCLIRGILHRKDHWTPVGNVETERGRARCERIKAFKFECVANGFTTVADAAICRGAKVDEHDFRRYKKGQFADNSRVATSIEGVLSGKTPLLDTRGRPLLPTGKMISPDMNQQRLMA